MIRKLYITFFIVLALYSNCAKGLESQWNGTDEVKLRLISPLSTNDFNEQFIIGLEYELNDGWKTYWKSPGAGGFPQEIIYSNSSNVSDIEIIWPSPSSFSILGLRSLGYENKVIFPIKIDVIDKYQPIDLNFNIHLLVCKDICIPVDVDLNLFIPSGSEVKLTNYTNEIEKYISLSPIKNSKNFGLSINKAIFRINNKDAILEIEIEQNVPFNNPKIYIDNDMGLPVIEPIIKFDKNKNTITAKFFYYDTFIDLENNNLNIHISDLPYVYEKSIQFDISNDNYNLVNNYRIINIIMIAILGGLILNLMPCVLPILSIKLLSVIKYSGKEKNFIRKGFLATVLGILFSYTLLALILLLMRYSGQKIGWGIQFQQPFFLMFISIVLLLFSFNLFGLFEIQIPNINSKFITKLFPKNLLYSDFFFGFFATLMATPCSAPFVGTAISFAFTQQSILLLLIFFFMGFGMSLPYLMIATFPSMISFIPKPGSWTLWVKKFMAILLLITLIWIMTILRSHFNYKFILISLIFSTTILSVLFLNKKFFLSTRFTFSIIFISIILYFLLPALINFNKFSLLKNDKWKNFNNINIVEMLDNNKIVFIDITADWCVTCQYNKQKVINTQEIQDLFNKFEVIQVRGDWTFPDKKIEYFLESYNRFGIPFNIMYSDDFRDGIIFSEILTKKSLKGALYKIKNKQ